MANKERNKRSARQARKAEREATLAAQAAAGTAPKAEPKVTKAVAKPKSARPGFFGGVLGYFGTVRSEMHRVVWPSKDELRNCSVGVFFLLLVFGVSLWLVDAGVIALLLAVIGLR